MAELLDPISTPEILDLLNPHASLLHNTLVQLAIFAIFAVPGYVVAILLLDKTGRRSIQVLGFFMMGLMFLLIGLIPSALPGHADQAGRRTTGECRQVRPRPERVVQAGGRARAGPGRGEGPEPA